MRFYSLKKIILSFSQIICEANSETRQIFRLYPILIEGDVVVRYTEKKKQFASLSLELQGFDETVKLFK